MARQFIARGHQVVGALEEADLHVVNSCTVTHQAARDSRKAARRAAREGLAARTVLTGCCATGEIDAARALDGVDLVVANRDKERLVEIVARELSPSTMLQTGDEPLERGAGLLRSAPLRSGARAGQDRGRLRHALRLLHHPAHARPPAQPAARRRRGRGARRSKPPATPRSSSPAFRSRPIATAPRDCRTCSTRCWRRPRSVASASPRSRRGSSTRALLDRLAAPATLPPRPSLAPERRRPDAAPMRRPYTAARFAALVGDIRDARSRRRDHHRRHRRLPRRDRRRATSRHARSSRRWGSRAFTSSATRRDRAPRRPRCRTRSIPTRKRERMRSHARDRGGGRGGVPSRAHVGTIGRVLWEGRRAGQVARHHRQLSACLHRRRPRETCAARSRETRLIRRGAGRSPRSS